MNRKHFFLSASLFLMMGAASAAQTSDNSPQPQTQAPSPPPEGRQGPGRGHRMEGSGTMGTIVTVSGDSLVVTRPDGTNVTVKLTGKTEFRKDRQPAKLTDFKAGDFVMVRGEENTDHSLTAQMIGGRNANGGQFFGEMGKDFVAGEVKSIDAPKLTVLRPDNATQTLELNEGTSLRKGRESITMADIQPGDHVVIRGAVQNNAFVPKTVMVLSPEQWERMQQFAQGMGGPATKPPAGAATSNPPQ